MSAIPPQVGKRSKWLEDENGADMPSPNRAKVNIKRQKTKSSRPTDSIVLSSHSASNTPPPARPPQSIYVPARTCHPSILPSRSVYSYERLNQIEEGSYGVVFRARDKQTGDIVALKKLKLDEEKHGFPITALREINALMNCRHDNVVGIREVVVGDTLTQYAHCPLITNVGFR
jgi:cell division cycle 2-like